MYKFILRLDRFFNKMLILSVVIFVAFFLGGCSPRLHEQPDLRDSVPSDTRIEYEAMQRFKASHKAFYEGLR